MVQKRGASVVKHSAAFVLFLALSGPSAADMRAGEPLERFDVLDCDALIEAACDLVSIMEHSEEFEVMAGAAGSLTDTPQSSPYTMQIIIPEDVDPGMLIEAPDVDPGMVAGYAAD